MPFACLQVSITALLLAIGIAGCSQGIAGLTTGSTAGPAPAAAAAAPPPATPTDRAIQVAATSAKADACGYNFDPARLRANYLAHEAQQGLAPPDLATLEKLYDTTRGRIAKSTGNADAFCTDEQTIAIKRDLVRHMAGDYTAAPKPAQSTASWWESGSSNKAWDPKKAVFPREVRD